MWTGRCVAAFRRDDLERGIEAGRERKIDLVVRVIEPRERHEVFLKAGLVPLAGADQRGNRRIESGMSAEPPAHHPKPFETVPERIRPERDLQNNQYVEKLQHYGEDNKWGRGVAVLVWLVCQNCTRRKGRGSTIYAGRSVLTVAGKNFAQDAVGRAVDFTLKFCGGTARLLH